MHMPALG